MAKVKNISGEDRLVPWLDGRLVTKGQVVEVPDSDLYAYTVQAANWEPGDAASKKLHDAAAKALDPEPESPADTPQED